MLPQKNQKFKEFYAPAIATNSIWRLLAGMVVLVVVYFVFMFLVFATLGAYILSLVKSGPDSIYSEIRNVAEGTEPGSVILLLLTFIGMFLGVLLAAKLVHSRGLRSLLGPNWAEFIRNFRIAFAIVVILTLISIPIFSIIEPPVKNMQLSIWVSWMLLGAPLLLLQVTSEELVFRGYMQQQLAARFDSRWIWLVLPSVCFGMLHYDPETLGSNAWIVVVHTTLFGLIAADVTTRTGNLGAAIGLHFANNLFALTIVSLDGSLSGLGLYKTSFHVSDEAAIRNVLVPDLIFVLLLYGLYLLWWKNRSRL